MDLFLCEENVLTTNKMIFETPKGYARGGKGRNWTAAEPWEPGNLEIVHVINRNKSQVYGMPGLHARRHFSLGNNGSKQYLAFLRYRPAYPAVYRWIWPLSGPGP